jgi:predicted NBD/HSP70 family sugar kinase
MSDPPPVTVRMHGLSRLAGVTVDAYNAELRDAEGFVGDRASSRAFRAIVEEWRDRLRKVGDDPLGEKPTDELSKKKLDKLLLEGDPEAAGVVHGAVEEFATELAKVTARFLKLKGWRDVERIAVGGGLRASRVGELAIGRASVILKTSGHEVELRPIHHHPDEAGLVGAVHLAPTWMLAGHDAILAVDVGGSNIRAGVVALGGKKGTDVDVAKAAVREFELWPYAQEEAKPSRAEAVDRLGDMLGRLVRRAEKEKLRLAPFVGVGCPGIIAEDGSIERGGQNLPGNWESKRFNLPAEIHARLPTIADEDTTVAMHNDAVVHGLSELPRMDDVHRWGILTMGTGLGNAAFTNRKRDD